MNVNEKTTAVIFPIALIQKDLIIAHAMQDTKEMDLIALVCLIHLKLLSVIINQNLLDIDECTALTHNCTANSFCTNTEGGFNCTCNQGFEAYGQICRGIKFTTYIYNLNNTKYLIFK